MEEMLAPGMMDLFKTNYAGIQNKTNHNSKILF